MSVQTFESLQTAAGQTTVARRTSAQDAAPTPSDAATDGFNLSSWTLRHQPLVIFLLVLLALFGVLAYGKLSQSEDPPFTFKVMVVRTFWPGATARQMQEEVTDRIARKLQESPEVDYLKSYSRPGESTLFFNIKDSVAPSKVSETWYRVRKKVHDISDALPAGVQGPFFNDEFGDVYTNIYALEGDGFSFAQLHDYAERLRAELLRVPDVAKVDFVADQEQRVYVEIANAQLAKLGLTPQQIAAAVNGQNAVAGSGLFTTASDRVFVRPTGQFVNEDRIADTLLRVNGRSIRLGDIASIQRGYTDPPEQFMRFENQTVLGIGLTMKPSGDVIEFGKALDAQMARLNASLPTGLKLVQVASMPAAVRHSVNDFVEAVAEAIGIVLAISLLSLGFRTGMVVVISIPLVLAGTALLMHLFGIGLHKVSLGTLILALGLLVDDAIIAVETMAVKLEQGMDRMRAAAFAYTSTAFPMLTGTLVTVAGFLPIALAASQVGEYTRSIFEVSAIALLLSWLAAVVVIPLLGFRILSETPAPHAGGHPGQPANTAAQHHGHDVYDTVFYRRLRGWIGWWPRARTHPESVRVGTCGIPPGTAAVLPELRAAGAARRLALAGTGLLCGNAASGGALRSRTQGSSGSGPLHRFRGCRRTAFLSLARSTAHFAQLRAVRDHCQERRGSREAAGSVDTDPARGLSDDPHASQHARKWAAHRLPGSVQSERPRNRNCS